MMATKPKKAVKSVKNVFDDSESDDFEYVPTAKELKQAGVESTSYGAPAPKELTGIALVKDQKRQREVDDIFAMMNQEDAFKNTTKRQKTDTALAQDVKPL